MDGSWCMQYVCMYVDARWSVVVDCAVCRIRQESVPDVVPVLSAGRFLVSAMMAFLARAEGTIIVGRER